MDLLEDVEERVYPVGRLDKDSEGLLLLTNDGNFANGIMHPSRHISKTYRVTVRPDVTEEQLITLSSSMELDGKMTQPATVVVKTKEPGRVVLLMTIHEGKNRQIRRMCESVGLGSGTSAPHQHRSAETGDAETGYLSGSDRRGTACDPQRHRCRRAGIDRKGQAPIRYASFLQGYP